MAKRQLIARYNFDGGYSDSRNPLAQYANVSAEGSFGILRLGESYNRPFQGYYTKGTLAASSKSTGAAIMFPLGDTWGGIKFNSGNASGSITEDADSKLYYIGAGLAMRQGITLQKQKETSGTFTYDATADISAANITETSHGLVTGGIVYLTVSSGAINTELSENKAYYVYRVDANTFRLCTTLANAFAGTGISLSAAVGVITVHIGEDIQLGSGLQVASEPVADTAGLNVFYKYEDDAGLARPDVPGVNVPTAIPANFSGLFTKSISFKIAAFRDRANTGNLKTVQATVRSVASATSPVVIPQNKVVEITFPIAATGQTHWAVFATRQDFGGTGVHYRAPYRTSADADATLYYGISETTVAAATNRTLTFDFRDGDLYPEEAWLYDYPPEDGTMFVDIDAVKVVLGAYDGTIGLVSLPNFKESYNPRHIITFPEPVTATLQRLYGEQALVACRNSIHALTYVGFRDDNTPSCMLQTLIPDVGIKKPQNWAYGAGMVVAWIDGAGLAMLDVSYSSGGNISASIDYEFGKEVSKFTRSWTADNVKVGFDPKTRSFVIGHQGVSISFCTESGVWGDPVHLTDCGFASTVTIQSMTAAQGELVVSMNDSSNYTAYSYDLNTGTTRMPICQIGQWITQESGGRANGIYEIALAAKQGGTINSTTAEPIIVGLHSNLFATHLRGNSVSLGAATITNTAAVFTSAWTGKRAVIFGTDIGGAGINYLSVVLTYSSTTVVTMTDPSTGNAVNAQENLSGCFMLVGEWFWTGTPVTGRDQHYYNFYPNLQDARSFTVSAYLPCLKGSESVIDGGVLAIDVFGTNWQTGTARIT